MSEPIKTFPLGLVLRACPDVASHARIGTITSWRDLMAVAITVRLMLGVSPSAYQDACDVMGPEMAAAAMACILERGGHINSAGGYLRDLTRQAEKGEFSLGPMLALIRANGDGERKRAEQISMASKEFAAPRWAKATRCRASRVSALRLAAAATDRDDRKLSHRILPFRRVRSRFFTFRSPCEAILAYIALYFWVGEGTQKTLVAFELAQGSGLSADHRTVENVQFATLRFPISPPMFAP